MRRASDFGAPIFLRNDAVKPEPIDLSGVEEPRGIAKRVIENRLGETQRLAVALERRDKETLHDFRIACKRLRYALERFESIAPALHQLAERLSMVQDALGEAHDRDVLLTILPPAMGQTQRRLQHDRETCVDRAMALWNGIRTDLERLRSHPF